LLKFLEDSTIQSVGSPLSKTVQVQVIAATNKDLRHLVSTGEFRADLYYRLAVLPVEIPPLRQHRDDLPFLIDILLSRINGDRQPSLSLSRLPQAPDELRLPGQYSRTGQHLRTPGGSRRRRGAKNSKRND
jgi:transcriptional regulator with GAF, ATPase, and Fis domain